MNAMQNRITADTRNKAQWLMDHDNWQEYWNAVILVDTDWEAPNQHMQEMQDRFNAVRASETQGIVYW